MINRLARTDLPRALVSLVLVEGVYEVAVLAPTGGDELDTPFRTRDEAKARAEYAARVDLWKAPAASYWAGSIGESVRRASVRPTRRPTCSCCTDWRTACGWAEVA